MPTPAESTPAPSAAGAGDYRLEPATAATVASCVQLAEAAHWPEVATRGSELELSEGVVAIHVPSGTVVGCCQYWLYGAEQAAIGFMLVLEEHRSVCCRCQ